MKRSGGRGCQFSREGYQYLGENDHVEKVSRGIFSKPLSIQVSVELLVNAISTQDVWRSNR